MFVQPDPYTCSPTALAYLLFKEEGVDFDITLERLIKESYRRFNDIKENGMGFDQLVKVAELLGISCRLSENKPKSLAYLTMVTKLPRQKFKQNDFIREAVKENSLRIEGEYYIYPYGHAVAVFEDGRGGAVVFDSLFGVETTIQLSELERYLEPPVSYFTLGA